MLSEVKDRASKNTGSDPISDFEMQSKCSSGQHVNRRLAGAASPNKTTLWAHLCLSRTVETILGRSESKYAFQYYSDEADIFFFFGQCTPFFAAEMLSGV